MTNWPDIKDKDAWLAVNVMGWHKDRSSAGITVWYEPTGQHTGYRVEEESGLHDPRCLPIFNPLDSKHGHNCMALLRGKMRDNEWSIGNFMSRLSKVEAEIGQLPPYCSSKYCKGSIEIYVVGDDELQAEGAAIFAAKTKEQE